MLETMAVIEGLQQIAKRFRAYPELLMHEVVVESGATEIIKLINREAEDQSEISFLIDEVRERAKLSNAVSFTFCPKSSIFLRHALSCTRCR